MSWPRNIKNNIPALALLLGLFILGLLVFSKERKAISFYGIAEPEVITINYNYPVIVNKIHVRPGEFVAKGTPLFDVSIIKTKSELMTGAFDIEELKARESILQKNKNAEIANLQIEKQLALNLINSELNKLEKDLKFKMKLTENLNSVSLTDSSYTLEKEAIKALQKRKNLVQKKYRTNLDATTSEKGFENIPYQKQINKLAAEIEFENNNQSQQIKIVAPTDGIVSTIAFKTNTYVPSFIPLMDFYAPHPKTIRGYIYENETISLSEGNEINIFSTINDTLLYKGKVIGLGSRITEVPERLRRQPAIKHYGREIEIAILDKDNILLQGEKVALQIQ